MSSVPKTGTQVYYPLLSKKYEQANPLQAPEQGRCRERYLLTGHFYVSLDTVYLFISKAPKAGPPIG
jgi:hypothetical protein